MGWPCCHVEKKKACCNQNGVRDSVSWRHWHRLQCNGFIWLSSEIFFGSESSNNGEFLPERIWELVRIKEIIEL